MQRLWSLQCRWDNESQLLDWSDYHQWLPCLNAISIPRWTTYGSHTLHCALHEFSYASAAAFAAAVYLHTVNLDDTITSLFSPPNQKWHLLKQSASRCVASRSFDAFRALSVPICESRTGRTPPLRSPDWVSHLYDEKSLSSIQLCNLLSGISWRHVLMHTNPADCASRGLALDLFEKIATNRLFVPFSPTL